MSLSVSTETVQLNSEIMGIPLLEGNLSADLG